MAQGLYANRRGNANVGDLVSYNVALRRLLRGEHRLEPTRNIRAVGGGRCAHFEHGHVVLDHFYVLDIGTHINLFYVEAPTIAKVREVLEDIRGFSAQLDYRERGSLIEGLRI